MAKYLLDCLAVFQGLRKSIVMLLLMAIGTILTVKGYLSGNNFVTLFQATVISYFGANGVEHVSSMVQAHLENKTAKPSTKETN